MSFTPTSGLRAGVKLVDGTGPETSESAGYWWPAATAAGTASASCDRSEVTQAVLDAWTVLQALGRRDTPGSASTEFTLQDAEKRRAYDIIWTKMRSCLGPFTTAPFRNA